MSFKHFKDITVQVLNLQSICNFNLIQWDRVSAIFDWKIRRRKPTLEFGPQRPSAWCSASHLSFSPIEHMHCTIACNSAIPYASSSSVLLHLHSHLNAVWQQKCGHGIKSTEEEIAIEGHSLNWYCRDQSPYRGWQTRYAFFSPTL